MFNHRHGRTGTLWEGRFKSCLVASHRYVLSVYRYIERNPVRAGMAANPEDYLWSSVGANLGLRFDSLVTPHPCFISLGDEADSRRSAYQAWLHAGEDEEQLRTIRSHLAQQRAYGDPRFQAMVERTLNHPASVRPRGRPAGSRNGT
jgi:putative transposase